MPKAIAGARLDGSLFMGITIPICQLCSASWKAPDLCKHSLKWVLNIFLAIAGSGCVHGMQGGDGGAHSLRLHNHV